MVAERAVVPAVVVATTLNHRLERCASPLGLRWESWSTMPCGIRRQEHWKCSTLDPSELMVRESGAESRCCAAFMEGTNFLGLLNHPAKWGQRVDLNHQCDCSRRITNAVPYVRVTLAKGSVSIRPPFAAPLPESLLGFAFATMKPDAFVNV